MPSAAQPARSSSVSGASRPTPPRATATQHPSSPMDVSNCCSTLAIRWTATLRAAGRSSPSGTSQGSSPRRCMLLHAAGRTSPGSGCIPGRQVYSSAYRCGSCATRCLRRQHPLRRPPPPGGRERRGCRCAPAPLAGASRTARPVDQRTFAYCGGTHISAHAWHRASHHSVSCRPRRAGHPPCPGNLRRPGRHFAQGPRRVSRGCSGPLAPLDGIRAGRSVRWRMTVATSIMRTSCTTARTSPARRRARCWAAPVT